MIIFGSRLFGKCDVIRGEGYIATQFFHVNFVPLFPMQSQFVIEGSEQGNEWRSIPLPLQWKSVGICWMRALCLLAVVMGWVGCLYLGSGPEGKTALALILAVIVLIGGCIFYWLTHLLGEASQERIYEVRRLIQTAVSNLPAGVEDPSAWY